MGQVKGKAAGRRDAPVDDLGHEEQLEKLKRALAKVRHPPTPPPTCVTDSNLDLRAQCRAWLA